MAPEITGIPQFKFEQLLSHTFPGFFLAFSIFMLIDVWSPLEVTRWAVSTVSSFLGVIGFIVLIGTIFGVFIDWMHHWLLEQLLFPSLKGFNDIKEETKNVYPEIGFRKIENQSVSYYYFFKTVTKESFSYMSENYYVYSEFYGNAFFSLIPFSFISPYYLSDVLKIPWILSFLFGGILFFLGWLSLYASYGTFLVYLRKRLDMLYGYLDYGSIQGIEVIPGAATRNLGVSVIITAQLKDGKWQDIKKPGVWINFETSLGSITPRKNTDNNGKAEAIFSSREWGKAIITARAGPIAGSTSVEVL